ncbi:MAG TPA: glycosyltransferase [Chitinophagales bacterium]|nr:glycosyltransferase [Chitinophagales bacterium]HRK28602.1 glycosyltransferase [Chitinophagales bacterium]
MYSLHIVSFDVPYPPNYGGAIDVYHKIKALSDSGVQIQLHCFTYGRKPAPELQALCQQVFYYPRKPFAQSSPLTLPYIVGSRLQQQLLERLVQVPAPILFEGLHTCGFLGHKELANRVKIVRMHNIETDYYHQLSQTETNLFKKAYLRWEAYQLGRFEPILQHATHIAAISAPDAQYLQGKFGNKAFLLPVFHGNRQINIPSGERGSFALYHGNLSVPENYHAALFLVEQVFAQLPLPLIVAGKNPSLQLQKAVAAQSNCRLYPNPSAEQMAMLMQQAHLHVLPTFQPTGIKLKLLNALYNGRFCVVNPSMVHGTGLEALCHIANSAPDFKAIINQLFLQPFTHYEAQNRVQVLTNLYDDTHNVQKLLLLL